MENAEIVKRRGLLKDLLGELSSLSTEELIKLQGKGYRGYINNYPSFIGWAQEDQRFVKYEYDFKLGKYTVVTQGTDRTERGEKREENDLFSLNIKNVELLNHPKYDFLTLSGPQDSSQNTIALWKDLDVVASFPFIDYLYRAFIFHGDLYLFGGNTRWNRRSLTDLTRSEVVDVEGVPLQILQDKVIFFRSILDSKKVVTPFVDDHPITYSGPPLDVDRFYVVSNEGDDPEGVFVALGPNIPPKQISPEIQVDRVWAIESRTLHIGDDTVHVLPLGSTLSAKSLATEELKELRIRYVTPFIRNTFIRVHLGGNLYFSYAGRLLKRFDTETECQVTLFQILPHKPNEIFVLDPKFSRGFREKLTCVLKTACGSRMSKDIFGEIASYI
jgi:hypothetical protein